MPEGLIPQKKLDNARAAFPIPGGERVLALSDFTIFGSCKEGVAVCVDRLRWKGGFGAGSGNLTWEELAAAEIKIDKSDIRIGGELRITNANTGVQEAIFLILTAIRDLANGVEPAVEDDEEMGDADLEEISELAELLTRFRANMDDVRGRDLRLSGSIPAEKEANARKHFPIPAEEDIVALLDSTVFGSNKTGIAFAVGGIYWRSQTPTSNGFLSWPQFARTHMSSKGGIVKLGDGTEISLAGASLPGPDAAALMEAVHAWAQKATEPESAAAEEAPTAEPEPTLAAVPLPPVTRRWMLAVAGVQSGPFDEGEIAAMLRARQVEPDACHAWTDGMPGWLAFRDVPDLAMLIPTVAAPPPPPPPPPAPGMAPPPPPPAAASGGMNVNSASVDELLGLPGVTRDAAERLVRERARRGGFATVEEVGEVLGLQPHQVEELRGEVELGRGARAGRVVDF